ncbi:MAG: STAS domain-containing protein [Chloroflexi bacterium]|nr:STAS domain-containing protein [Chloroflexota bacterium]
MEVTITQYKRCDVIKAAGRIDSNTAPQLAEALKSIIDAGRYKIIFDMKEVNFVSSKGWWVLIDTQKQCKRYKRGELVLVNIRNEIQESLKLIGMGSYFKIYDDIVSAVGSF